NGLASSGNNQNLKPANTLAADLGLYYKNEIYLGGRVFDMSLGGVISNLGGKVTYSSDDNKAFIPANLKIGTFFQTEIDASNKIGFGFDINKLLVPTPDTTDANRQNQSTLSGVFNSFGDAPGGFSEELSEYTLSIGAEYWYQNTFAVRAGFFNESKDKGNRKYFSIGAGLQYQDFGLDLAYLIPTQQNNPLGRTIRFTLAYTPGLDN
ncbi:MAG: type IX secretion system outer membrane channel protein PorV, partial [Cyclobacteriaceae bacterium]